MTRTLLASVLAGAIAVTSLSTAPVSAGDRDNLGRFLLGAGTLLIIGGAISNSNKNRHSTRTVPHKPRVVKPHRRVVPAACLRNNKFNNGPRRFFGQRCLNNNMRGAHRLPSNCLRSVHTNRGVRYVYAARCLRKNGWQFG